MEHIIARNSGENYQACHFWDNALNLLIPNSHVSQVTIENKNINGFEDVVVYYDPPKEQNRPIPLKIDFQQIKWHSNLNYSFGYRDLADPKFTNSKSKSLLEKLKEAHFDGDSGCRYSFITTARIKTDDPLQELVSGEDGYIKIEKLRHGKGDKSKMGKVRKLWKNVLEVNSDSELYRIIENLVILEGSPILGKMRDKITEKATTVGLNFPYDGENNFEFIFEYFSRRLIEKRLNTLDKELLIEFLEKRGIKVITLNSEWDRRNNVAIISFSGRPTTNYEDFESTNILKLNKFFDDRYLKKNIDWNKDIGKLVTTFLKKKVESHKILQLTLDTHSSIAFVSGQTLPPKSGIESTLVQNGRRGKEFWHINDGSGINSSEFKVKNIKYESGSEMAVAISITRPIIFNVEKFIRSNKIEIGNLIEFSLVKTGQLSVLGGHHAALLSDQVTDIIVEYVQKYSINRVHLFISAPNSFVFYLGQHSQAIGKYQMYEFDFDKIRESTYIPSIGSMED